MTFTDRIMDLSLCWKQVSIVFPYFEQRRIDWEETYRIYLEKAMQIINILFDDKSKDEFIIGICESLKRKN